MLFFKKNHSEEKSRGLSTVAQRSWKGYKKDWKPIGELWKIGVRDTEVFFS